MHQENLVLFVPVVKNVCAGTSCLVVGKSAALWGFPAQGGILEVILMQRMLLSYRNIPEGVTSLPEMDLPGSGALQGFNNGQRKVGQL